ncbi:MAG: ATP-binding protein [Planctomycetes bacterium]|nr:ATP-binding protein [Planctomycetota bacterium]
MPGESKTNLTPGSTNDELARRDELAVRLRWLVGLRWVALGGVVLAVLLAGVLDLVRSPVPLLAVAALMLCFNLGFQSLHRLRFPRTLRALSSEALMQIGLDVIGLGVLIFFSGGLSNPFVFYFMLHVGIAATLLDRSTAYGVAALTTGVCAFLAAAHHIDWLGSWPLRGPLEVTYNSPLGQWVVVFALGTTLLFSVYLVSTIMTHLRSRDRDVRRLNADLAERLRLLAATEHKLSDEHQRARAILDCMDEGVIVVDLGGQVLLANSAAQARAIGTLEETLQRAGVAEGPAAPARQPAAASASGNGEACGDDHCEHDQINDQLAKAVARGGKLDAAALVRLGGDAPPAPPPAPRLHPPLAPKRVEIALDGRIFENTASTVRTMDNEPLGLVVVSRDVTERRSLEKQVVHAEKLHAAGSLAAGVAHELNTPLGTILGYAQMLLEDAASDQARKDLRAIEDQARRCRKIVQGLLDFARKPGGERSLRSVGELTRKAVELTAHALEMRGIHLKHLGPASEDRSGLLSVNANQIEQVLVNLITNAADAIEEAAARGPSMDSDGGGTIGIGGSFDPATGQALVFVEDDGPGVPEDLRREIFEPFFTTKVAGKGTGLGLSIARRMIEDHGGTLVLSARKDGRSGARFEVRLPAVPRGAGRASSAAAVN